MVIGFPAPATGTAKGWKLKKLDEIMTEICPVCVKEVSDKIMEKRPAFMEIFKKSLKIELGIVLICTLVFLFHLPNILAVLSVAAAVIWGGITLFRWAKVSDMTPKLEIDKLHREYKKSKIDEYSKK